MAQTSVKFGVEQLENVKEYKYLGVVFSANGSYKQANSERKEKGLKAVFKLIRALKDSTIGFNTAMHLFAHTIKPILLYGSEISCPLDKTFDNENWHGRLYNKSVHSEIEKPALLFYRYLLGVGRQTSLNGIYGELGAHPIFLDATISMLKYHIRLLHSDNALLIDALNENIKLADKGKMTWLKSINKVWKAVGIGTNNLNSQSIRQACSRLKTGFESEWHRQLFNDNRKDPNARNKLRFYRTFKTSFGQCEYLTRIKNGQMRRNFTKLRISDHQLHIEKGRYIAGANRLPADERFCKVCGTNNVEDEIHFLLRCPCYESLRQDALNKIYSLYPSVEQLPDDTKASWLMGCPFNPVINIVGSFIHKALAKRNEICQI